MGISDVHPPLISSACFSLSGERSWTGERTFSEGEEPGGQSHCDGDRKSAEAKDKGLTNALQGVVWRGIAIFESGALISPDCLAFTGAGWRRSERVRAGSPACRPRVRC